LKRKIEFNDVNSLEKFFWKHFGYLRRDYQIIKISVEIENIAFYLIAVGKANIFFMRDPEGALDVLIGKRGIEDHWKNYDSLDTLVYFLSNKSERASNPNVDFTDPSLQARFLSSKLSAHLSQIEDLMSDKYLLEIRKEIDKAYVELMEKDMEKNLSEYLESQKNQQK
jgi:hypothetical protein